MDKFLIACCVFSFITGMYVTVLVEQGRGCTVTIQKGQEIHVIVRKGEE